MKTWACISTCVGDDTRRDGWGLVHQIKQAVAEQARREASYRTRRGQEGKALVGQSTGGRAYGYVAAADSPSGQIEIDETQAAIVRRIFQMYADGWSARNIAARFNAEGVPSPGATWKRTKRRTDGKWLASAIHGDQRCGTGILNNRRYIGVILWGRSEWKRSAADSAVRRQRMLDKVSVERGEDACAISLSVPRVRIERVFMDYMASPELPRVLSEVEGRWLSSQPLVIDYRPRIAELERQRANLVGAIKSGGLAAELGAELKALSTESDQLKALTQVKPLAPRKAPQESVERRVERMLERLGQGGEVAQGVVRELFPGGIWLYPDTNGGRYLWAHAQTAMPNLAAQLDANGYLPAQHWPRVYSAIADKPRNDVRVVPFRAHR